MASRRAFLCEACGDSFSSSWSFQRHSERRHPLAVRRVTVRRSNSTVTTVGRGRGVTESGQDFEAVSEAIQRNLLTLLETDDSFGSFPALTGEIPDITLPASVVNEDTGSSDSFDRPEISASATSVDVSHVVEPSDNAETLDVDQFLPPGDGSAVGMG